jgi:hypothetical protein
LARFPAETVTLLWVLATVKLGAKMTWVRAVEVLAANLESPPYAAVMECVPAVSVDVVKIPKPPLFNVALPIVAVPSRKFAVPVGVPEALEVTVTVNVTGAPLAAEAAELINVDVVALGAAGVMVSVTATEVLAVKLESPP